MATGTIPTLVKRSGISGTSDSNGNIRLSMATQKVLIARLDDSGGTHIMGIPFLFHNGQTYLHVTTTQGNAVGTVSLTGEYYYTD